jgi:hypothetical protein
MQILAAVVLWIDLLMPLQHQFEMEEVKGTLRSLIYNLFFS